MFQDGWVCRACWKPNRAQDKRCFSCRTPRDQQLEVEAGSQAARIRPGAHLEGRLDADVALLTVLASWPLRIYGYLCVGIGILILIFGLISSPQEPETGISSQLVVAAIGLAIVVWGILQIAIAKSVRRHSRFAYVLALLMGLLGSLPRLLSVGPVEEIPEGIPQTIWLLVPWLYLGIAVCAVVLLIASFILRDSEGGASATTTV